MGIAVEANDVNIPTRAAFPCLMVDSDGMVVLFECSEEGTVVRPVSGYDIGTYKSSWVMTCFVPFTGSITLSNTKD